MATGSGKTLVMHVNLWQILRCAQNDRGTGRYANILLITPNDGLSRQHLDEFRKSGIAARHHSEGAGSHGGLPLQGDAPVTVIEITKLTESKQGGGLSVGVAEFEGNNLIFVDEGHRGASGDVWRALRAKVAENGFTFEYSATFGQIVNGASTQKDKDTGKSKRETLLEEYSKAILCDYSYPHFYHDGYGKDYWILNLKDERAATEGSPYTDWMLLGNLMSFYEQCLAYEENREAFRPYDIEPPLWVFVGHSVTGGKTREDQETLTDVEEIIAFFAKFLSDKTTWTARIGRTLKGETGLKNQRDEDLFRDLFPYLKGKGLQPTQIYDGIVQRVFHAQAGETLRAVELKAAAGEIGLRAGADSPYFGVINIGDVSGLMKLLREQGIPCEDENMSGSLFDRIKDPQSTVNALIGSRKFMEGWDSFRVASMGLLNIGKGEGSQIIQLFGRGVRLWGKDRSLKRSAALGVGTAPSHIGLLETLNVFGVRANYMAQFREYLKQEGVETDFEEITVPVCVQDKFLSRGLQVLRLPEGETFQEKEGVVLVVDDNIRVTLDLRPRLEFARSGTDEEVMEKAGGEDKAATLKQLAPLLNWERIYFDLLDFKRVKGFHNLSFTEATLRAIVEQGNYTVLCPDGQLPPVRFRDLRRTEDIATSVLRKYIAAFYDRQRRAWEREHLRLVTLTKDDPNLKFETYAVRVKPELIETVRQLVAQADALHKLDEKLYPHIHFARHLYQPLLVTDKQERMESTPPALNAGEAQFVRDLRDYLQKNSKQFEGKEVFLLRNLTKGRGIGFFEISDGEAFYPDSILWVIEDGKQWITFIDPHGLRMAEGGFNDHKIRLHKDLKTLEPTLQSKGGKWQVHLTSFILSTSLYDEIRRTFGTGQHEQEEFERNHVVFQEEGSNGVGRLFALLRKRPH